jgi:hypothetical protein
MDEGGTINYRKRNGNDMVEISWNLSGGTEENHDKF